MQPFDSVGASKSPRRIRVATCLQRPDYLL